MNNYYIDMDGVLVKYDRSAYLGDNPRYLRKGEHYFRDLIPDTRMLQVVETLLNKKQSVSILTSITNNGDLYAEHIGDKIAWLKRYLPELNIQTQFITTISAKRDIITAIQSRELTNHDILIDDFNRNLVNWSHGGGIGIKYANGLNNPDSYDGLSISVTASATDIISLFDALQNTPQLNRLN